METKTSTYADIINNVIMEPGTIPPSSTITPDVPVTAEGKEAGWNVSIVTSGAQLKEKGWFVSTVVRKNPASLSFSVQLPGGRGGYSTDILNRFLSEETIREYAEHALATIIEQNKAKVAHLA